MILTVTPNPALDLTWHVDRLLPGETHRVDAGATRAGGKGLNVARVLHAQGHDVIALATSGGGVGAEFAAELVASGIPHRLVPVAAPTRRSIAIVDEAAGETSVLNEHGDAISPDELAALMANVVELAHDADAVAICGSLPPGFGPDQLGELVCILTVAGTPVIVDTSGPAMLAAARAGAIAVKPNAEELLAATGAADTAAGIAALLELGAGIVVASLGAEGLVVATADASDIRARLPRALHGNATGAGDAAVAAIAAAVAETPGLTANTPDGESARIRLARRATAWSASAVLMPLAGELSPEHDGLEREVVVSPASEPKESA
ncbi:1-phosphofructokinase family hexose kinase [Agromyces subbeticus]|uniref:1-phosphofructokinase family hexose kinase n=1 Tax=Agromyces subbeticus TaxID=293890 RepID=UPI0003B331E8|nr:hexose kinase [Agromyces subbeticus]